jgi:hypothetical protein
MAIKKITFNWPESVPLDQINHQFIQGMLDRMAQGFHVYGHALREDHKPDSIACLKLRIKKYRETHNTEFLIDAANYAMMEFMKPKDSKAFFLPTTKRESPGAILQNKKRVKGKEDFE